MEGVKKPLTPCVSRPRVCHDDGLFARQTIHQALLLQSPMNVRQTLPLRSPIVAGRQKAPIARAAQQKGSAIASPLCEVKHGHANFLPRAARLPRLTVCFGSQSAARLFFNFHGGFATQGREPRIKICYPALSAADKLKI